MGNGHIFRIILLVGFALIVPFGIWHAYKSHTGRTRKKEGLFILVALRLAGLTGMLTV